MFNSKALQKELEIALKRNQELVTALEECSKSHSNDFVIKLVPNNSDQFYVDGDFIVDDCRAVYGSHQLSFSEAVCWKAGKEVARRAYEEVISDSEDKMKKACEEQSELKLRLESSEAYSKSIQSELASAMCDLYVYRDKCDIAEKSLDILRTEIDRLNAQISEITKSRDEYRKQLEDSKHKLESFNSIASDGLIITPYGEVYKED